MAPLARGRQLDILREIATRHGIDLVDTARIFEPASFLPNDGHLSPHGARLMAELIAEHLARLPRAARDGR
jgi:lysophospholipase L1-like esterase